MNIEEFLGLEYDMGFGRIENIILNEFIANTFLVDYGGKCPIFEDLAQNIQKFNERKINGPLEFVYRYMDESNKVKKIEF